MEINRVLSIIYASYNKFESLPDDMSTIINKTSLGKYLLRNKEIEHKTIEMFLGIIYDENEEDQENILRSVFDEKYHSLLRLVEEEQEEQQYDEEQMEVRWKNRTKDKEIDTPQKMTMQLPNLGSPIQNNGIDNSLEGMELFKEIKIKERNRISNDKRKVKDKEREGKRIEYSSIIRPTNAFKITLNSIMQPKTSKNSPYSPNNNNKKKKDNIIHNHSPITQPIIPKQLSKINLDFNLQNYKKKNMKFIRLSTSTRQNISLYKPLSQIQTQAPTPTKPNTIRQKMQDIYTEIHSKELLPTTPLKQQLFKNYYYSNNKKETSGVMNSNNITTDEYFNNIQKTKHSLNSSSIKPMGAKVIPNDKKPNHLYKNNTKSKKYFLDQKLNSLTRILNSKSVALHGEKILSEDDFTSLEDKMSQFEMIKKKTIQPYGMKKKTVFKREFEDEFLEEKK